MSERDRQRWDQRYRELAPATEFAAGPPTAFRPFAHAFPTAGQALELACGRGQASVWLALRGMTVLGVDVSPVAVAAAAALATKAGVDGHCTFTVVDLDDGLPAGPPVDVILCHRFRDARLDQPVLDRLAPGGLLAISALSQVGGHLGPFRIEPGELTRSFAGLEVVAHGESDGEAWLLARNPDTAN